jgi:putative endonuclease
MNSYFVYILASKKNGTLYIGITNDLVERVWQHKNKIADGFTKDYNVDKLVYFEETPDVLGAITREKQLKKWNRVWKIRIIEEKNPDWKDLYNEITG